VYAILIFQLRDLPDLHVLKTMQPRFNYHPYNNQWNIFVNGLSTQLGESLRQDFSDVILGQECNSYLQKPSVASAISSMSQLLPVNKASEILEFLVNRDYKIASSTSCSNKFGQMTSIIWTLQLKSF